MCKIHKLYFNNNLNHFLDSKITLKSFKKYAYASKYAYLDFSARLEQVALFRNALFGAGA